MKFNFEDLQVYQKSLDLVDIVYEVSKQFPKEEIYGLTSQFRRAAVSISLNIAEGSGGTKKEFLKFLRTASNSLKECIVCITVAQRQNFISTKDHDDLRKKLIEISKMISGLRNYLLKE
ncbi:four helix bundle protein [Salinimicrobium sp. HB62]|uniref:four helix bundle protein n=1 Tax=Salinimicrobium sp. HB62 TaxID=3077781 RepID=UPI002D77C8CD|nr:four helix bundle protein [Salinimicrobium sp. HB62]